MRAVNQQTDSQADNIDTNAEISAACTPVKDGRDVDSKQIPVTTYAGESFACPPFRAVYSSGEHNLSLLNSEIAQDVATQNNGNLAFLKQWAAQTGGKAPAPKVGGAPAPKVSGVPAPKDSDEPPSLKDVPVAAIPITMDAANETAPAGGMNELLLTNPTALVAAQSAFHLCGPMLNMLFHHQYHHLTTVEDAMRMQTREIEKRECELEEQERDLKKRRKTLLQEQAALAKEKADYQQVLVRQSAPEYTVRNTRDVNASVLTCHKDFIGPDLFESDDDDLQAAARAFCEN